jgi:hypothetical protein
MNSSNVWLGFVRILLKFKQIRILKLQRFQQMLFYNSAWTYINVVLCFAHNCKHMPFALYSGISHTSPELGFRFLFSGLQIVVFCLKKSQKTSDNYSMRLNITRRIKPRSNISNTKDRVWPHVQKPRRQLKIRRVAEYFWRTSRCLEMWSNRVLSVWYIFSMETKTEERTEK